MFLWGNSIIRGRYYPQYSRKSVDNWRGLWESQQIAVEFDVITGETRGKCTKVLDRAYLSILFSPVSAQIMRQDAVYIFLPDNLILIKVLLRVLTFV